MLNKYFFNFTPSPCLASFIVSTLHLPAFHIIITVGPVATREHFTISGAQGLNIAAFSTVQYSTVQYSTVPSTYSTSSPRLLACCNVLLSGAVQTSCNADCSVKWVVCKIIIKVMEGWWVGFPGDSTGSTVGDKGPSGQ